MPLIFRNPIAEKGELALWKVTEPVEGLLDILREQGIYADVPFFRNMNRLAEWLTARILLSLLGVKQKIIYDELGKPHLEGEGSYISISHSGQFVCVIFHPECAVGVDIERMGDRIQRVKRKFIN